MLILVIKNGIVYSKDIFGDTGRVRILEELAEYGENTLLHQKFQEWQMYH